MIVFSTLSGKKEKLPAPDKRPLRLFVCGPTVYDYSHIGHARTYIAFDIFVRWLKASGYKTFYLQNITDIDDKIIERAKKEKTNALSLAKKFEKEYYKDMKALGVLSVNKYARATDYIPQIIKQIQTLSRKGYAYKINGDGYYFDISKFKDYGKLSKRTKLQAEDAVSRIDQSVHKRNKGDFALWKFSESGEPFWNSPLGNGRPGWHIEDTAISEYYFGPQYDIHGGAVDLKFPHHEAEIAQQEAASGKKPFVKIWMHTGFLLVNGEKMSKSKGNFITIRDFLKKYPAEVLRMIVLAHHYRSPVDYSEKIAEQSKNSLENLARLTAKLSMVRISGKTGRMQSRVAEAEKKFYAAMADDFNTPKAIAAIFDFANELQTGLHKYPKKDAVSAKNFIQKTFSLLGITLKTPHISGKIKAMAEKRELLRRDKQFMQADRLRKQIDSLGYTIEDAPQGPFIWPKKIH